MPQTQPINYHFTGQLVLASTFSQK